MKTVLSTETMDPRAQFASFQKAICSEIVNLSAQQKRAGEFRALIRRHRVGHLGYAFVDCEPVLIERSVKNIRQDKADHFFLAMQIDGVGYSSQLGREVELSPGDYSIVDSTLPYTLRFEGSVRRLIVQFPRSEVVKRGCVAENVCGQAFRGEGGTSGLASRLIRMLGCEGEGIDVSLGELMSGAVLDVVAAAEPEDNGDRRSLVNIGRAGLLRRVRVIVLTHLSDPDLSTERLAGMAGISVRYLHKIFSETGTTVHQWIEEERLRRCYQSLTDPKQRHRTIQDIAFSCGFNDSGHFSRRFSRKYGFSPSRARTENGRPAARARSDML
jgi:AraC family transcriptional regulator, positive regulator of tynA and feaB